MEKEEKNGGENPNSTQEDDTFVILDPDEEPENEINNGASQHEEVEQCHSDANTSDSTKVSQTIQPDSSGGPGTAPDMPEQNGSTTLPTTASPGEALKLKSNERPGTAPDMLEQNGSTILPTTASPGVAQRPGTAPDMPEQNGSTTLLTTDSPGETQRPGTALDMPEQNGSNTLPTTDSPGEAQRPGTAPDMTEQNGSTTLPTTASPGEAQRHGTAPDMPEQNGSTTLPTTDSPGEALKLKSNEINEQMKEPQATALDNGASQGGEEFQIAVDIKSGKTDVSLKIVKPNNPGDNGAPPPENKQSGSENLQSESGSSHAGGKDVEEKEAHKKDANGRSKEEMETSAGANKDDANEARLKEKKANGEGVKGEGGTEDAVKLEERVVKERPVSISLCTSAYRFNVEGLVSYLKGLMKQHPQLIKEVKVHELPYNDLDHYKFDDKFPVDVMILCHSINNRRFAITDVMDALYDKYLPYCARVVGKEKMGVIVHDFDDMRGKVQSSRMSSFKYKQPKAFETTSLQIACGHIEKEEQVLKQMLKADQDKIVGFLEHASKYPEEMQKEETNWKESLTSLKRFIPDLKMPSFGFGSKANEGQIGESNALRSMGSNISTAEREQNHGSSNEGTPVDQPASSVAGGWKLVEGNTEQSASRTPRPISVSVCSSAYQNNVKGLLSWFAKFQAEQSHMITDVRFRQLPYNDIDSFRFPPDDPVDVMILCHSVDNRGFSITNVENAIYEKYLKYCNKLIGKKKLAVIVHDFADCKPAIVESRMESFRRMQKLTFELVDTVIICGSLEDSDKLGIRKDDETRLIRFLEFARFEPKENLKQSLLGKLF